MNEQELRDHLKKIARNLGTNSLTENEVDFMNRKISFATYQNRCYAEYCQGNLSKPRSSK